MIKLNEPEKPTRGCWTRWRYFGETIYKQE